MGGLLKSSVAKKFAMALSGLFLVLFLAQHFTINLTSVISPDVFNEISHFMGTNIL
jgi:succinate dehydrogenase / fumarate reductase cytochrome b subunit